MYFESNHVNVGILVNLHAGVIHSQNDGPFWVGRRIHIRRTHSSRMILLNECYKRDNKQAEWKDQFKMSIHPSCIHCDSY